MTDNWLIWGMGGHGRVVADLIAACGLVVVGFVDREPNDGTSINEVELLARLGVDRSLPLGASAIALGIGDNRARLAAWQQLPPSQAPSLIHPTAWCSPSATCGAGTVVLPKAVVHTGARIGDAVIINTAAVVEHDCVVGDGAHISPGVVLAGGVAVGRRSWVGAGAVVIPGVSIGADATVGAGAIVIRDVPDGATVVGNPARRLANNRDDREQA